MVGRGCQIKIFKKKGVFSFGLTPGCIALTLFNSCFLHTSVPHIPGHCARAALVDFQLQTHTNQKGKAPAGTRSVEGGAQHQESVCGVCSGGLTEQCRKASWRRRLLIVK